MPPSGSLGGLNAMLNLFLREFALCCEYFWSLFTRRKENLYRLIYFLLG